MSSMGLLLSNKGIKPKELQPLIHPPRQSYKDSEREQKKGKAYQTNIVVVTNQISDNYSNFTANFISRFVVMTVFTLRKIHFSSSVEHFREQESYGHSVVHMSLSSRYILLLIAQYLMLLSFKTQSIQVFVTFVYQKHEFLLQLIKVM